MNYLILVLACIIPVVSFSQKSGRILVRKTSNSSFPFYMHPELYKLRKINGTDSICSSSVAEMYYPFYIKLYPNGDVRGYYWAKQDSLIVSGWLDENAERDFLNKGNYVVFQDSIFLLFNPEPELYPDHERSYTAIKESDSLKVLITTTTKELLVNRQKTDVLYYQLCSIYNEE